jgi:hypothetical protein
MLSVQRCEAHVKAMPGTTEIQCDASARRFLGVTMMSGFLQPDQNFLSPNQNSF